MKNPIKDYVRPEIMEDLKYGTNVISGDDYRQILYGITQVAAELVEDTLGPYGRTLLVEDGSYVYATKDGWANIKRLMFEDPMYNMLYRTIRSTSFGTVTTVGDGSTSTMLGANFFLQEVLAYMEKVGKNKFRQAEFLETIENIKNLIISSIENSEDVHHIDPNGDFSDIYQVAYISSNGNDDVAKIIQTIYQETHGNTNIHMGLDSGKKLTYDIVNGYKTECKPFKLKSYRNREDGSYTRTDPARVFFFDHNITYTEHQRIITSISQYYGSKNEEVIIFAPYFDDVMATVIEGMIQSHEMRHSVPNICFVQIPTSTELMRNCFGDMAVICNANIFDHGKVRAFNEIVMQAERPDDKLEDVLNEKDGFGFTSTNEIIELCAGTIREAILTENEITIQRFHEVVDEKKYRALVEDVKSDYLRAKTKAEKSSTILMKDYQSAMTRYIKLQGNIGRIQIGAQSDEQKLFLRDAIEDAIFACKSAYENGYMRGLNLTTLSAISEILLQDNGSFNETEITVLEMFYRVFYNITATVMEKKWPEEERRSVVIPGSPNSMDVATTMDNYMIISSCITNHWNYNLVTEKLERDGHWSVIGPVKTDIAIINAITSVLTLLLTSSQYVSQMNRFDKRNLLRISNEKEIQKKHDHAKAMAEGFMDGIVKYREECKLVDNVITEWLSYLKSGVKDPQSGNIMAYHDITTDEPEK